MLSLWFVLTLIRWDLEAQFHMGKIASALLWGPPQSDPLSELEAFEADTRPMRYW